MAHKSVKWGGWDLKSLMWNRLEAVGGQAQTLIDAEANFYFTCAAAARFGLASKWALNINQSVTTRPRQRVVRLKLDHCSGRTIQRRAKGKKRSRGQGARSQRQYKCAWRGPLTSRKLIFCRDATKTRGQTWDKGTGINFFFSPPKPRAAKSSE